MTYDHSPSEEDIERVQRYKEALDSLPEMGVTDEDIERVETYRDALDSLADMRVTDEIKMLKSECENKGWEMELTVCRITGKSGAWFEIQGLTGVSFLLGNNAVLATKGVKSMEEQEQGFIQQCLDERTKILNILNEPDIAEVSNKPHFYETISVDHEPWAHGPIKSVKDRYGL